jgi:hypothetical protein
MLPHKICVSCYVLYFDGFWSGLSSDRRSVSNTPPPPPFLVDPLHASDAPAAVKVGVGRQGGPGEISAMAAAVVQVGASAWAAQDAALATAVPVPAPRV